MIGFVPIEVLLLPPPPWPWPSKNFLDGSFSKLWPQPTKIVEKLRAVGKMNKTQVKILNLREDLIFLLEENHGNNIPRVVLSKFSLFVKVRPSLSCGNNMRMILERVSYWGTNIAGAISLGSAIFVHFRTMIR
jgi:hypothetical protein